MLGLADFIVELYASEGHASSKMRVYANMVCEPSPLSEPALRPHLDEIFSRLAQYLRQTYVRHYRCDVTPRTYINFDSCIRRDKNTLV